MVRKHIRSIQRDRGNPHHFSPLTHFLSISLQKRACLQEATSKHTKTEYNKTKQNPSFEGGKTTQQVKRKPEEEKKFRNTSAPTVRSPTEHRPNGHYTYTKELVQTHTSPAIAASVCETMSALINWFCGLWSPGILYFLTSNTIRPTSVFVK